MYAADLHIHSKYSRATSSDCVPAMLDLWSRRKGISLLGTGDFTHPAWRQMLTDQLIEAEDGLYRLSPEFAASDPFAPPDAVSPRFVISGEISSIYKQGGRVRKVHSVILLPSLQAAETLSRKLESIGNIHSDGRPILGLSAHDLLDVTLNACPEAIFIPAHIWTPHFSLFGAFSGFDTIEECFMDLTPHIHALETGLSSDPAMNWRLSALDKYTLVSNSDAHSPAKLGRELNLIDGAPSYQGLKRALEEGTRGGFHSTVEFFPEEGKYHFDGHRSCSVCLSPDEAVKLNGICPVCGKRMTPGVYHRVAELADRAEGCQSPENAAPYISLVPLLEVIASVSGVSAASRKAQDRYEALIHALGSELTILQTLPIDEIERTAGKAIAEGIRRMRAGEVGLSPGFDGEYGKVQLMNEDERRALTGQMTFLDALLPEKPRKTAAKSPDPLPEKPVQTVSAAPAASAGLNEEQRAAVESTARTVAVIAGPGSGKTKTLVARIAHLIETGVKPSSIAAVTFTNKAAAEMRQRLTQRFGNRRAIQGMTIGTFHSISLALLRRSRPGLTLLDEAAALCAAGDIVNGLALSMTPARFLKELGKHRAGEPCALDETALDLWKQRLLSLSAATFDDLLADELADELPPPFSHLLVDEYQDVNDVQRALTKKWSESGESLFVIGDADQSIYGFRGADAACFDALLSDHPDAELISLKMNYRSAPEILACALPLIAHNGGQRHMEAGRTDQGLVRRIPVSDEYAEGVVIAKEIARLVGGMDMIDSRIDSQRQIGFSDIAVLYRTHRQAEAIEKCLAAEGIPYTVAGREDYLSSESVTRALAFLRLYHNPSDRAALRVLLPKAEITLPDNADFSALCRQLSAQDAALSETLAACAPKSAKEKPKKLLERWKKACSIKNDPSFDRLIAASQADTELSSFLSDVTLGAEGDIARTGGRTYSADSVRLMTLHGSKGLEFPIVFLAGIKRGVLPLETPYGRPTDLPEERRLLYVGMTRAKDELILLTHPEESPFLGEIPADKLHLEQAVYQRKSAPAKQLSFL